MSAKPKTLAEEALGSLLTMPMPRTERDFRRAVILAALIGRQIEADFAVCSPAAFLTSTPTTQPTTQP